ncbi:MAG: hypothetical protein BMS9Abin18_0526 [Zetaproteobacteria bacterium]|nr:MAG: hypothetical protein BMS9Abin18_0526 [Zetaproteobacteria bacterium]
MRRSARRCFWVVLITTVYVVSGLAEAGVIPDGGTATTVQTAGNGLVTVNIAPVISDGISHNTYTQFDVLAPGVDLNNLTVNARTILNEVTSANPSLIQGQLRVLGPRAHVILANPNGITVDGGSFVNTGGLALSTGRASFVTRPVTPLTTQQNIVLTTSQGQIIIQGAGLTGLFTHLDLIAKQIRVDGSVTNQHPSANAEIVLIAGSSTTEFDSSVFPTNTTSPWMFPAANGGADATALIDITALGQLTSGRIEVAVTDQGAGVRFAGNMVATLGDFSLNASGLVEINGGGMTAGNDILLDTASVTAGPAIGGRSFSMTARRHIDLLADAVMIQGGNIQAGDAANTGDITIGRNGVVATGDIVISGIQNIAAYEAGTLTATGGIGLFGETKNVMVRGSNLSAGQQVRIAGANITLDSVTDASGSIQTSNITSADASLNATGGIFMTGAHVSGSTGAAFTAVSINLQSFGAGNSFRATEIRSDLASVNLAATGALTLSGSDVLGQTDITATAGNFISQAVLNGKTWRKSEMTAALGGLVLKTTAGGIINRGSVLQGTNRIVGNPDSSGGVSILSAAGVENTSLDASTLGIMFSQQDDLFIQAAGGVTNTAGRMISNANVLLSAGGDLLNQMLLNAPANAGIRQNYSYTAGHVFFRPKRVHGWRVDYGNPMIPGQLAFITAGGNVGINAANITNSGGEIDANGGDITVTGGSLDNTALLTGRAWLEHRCAWFCRGSGASDVAVNGGSFSASRNLNLNITNGVTNNGGIFLALQDMSINAASVSASSLPTYQYLSTSRGMSTLWSGRNARLLRTDQGGNFVANMGVLSINALTPVTLDGGILQGGGGVMTPGGVNTIRKPVSDSPVSRERIGILEFLFK